MVGLLITKLLIAESASEFFFISVNIWQSYKQERGCLMHFARLANTLLKDSHPCVVVKPRSPVRRYPIAMTLCQGFVTSRCSVDTAEGVELVFSMEEIQIPVSKYLNTPVPSVNYCDGLDRCILYCILFVSTLALLYFCVSTVFAANKDLYKIILLSSGKLCPKLWTFKFRRGTSIAATCYVNLAGQRWTLSVINWWIVVGQLS